MSQLNLFGSEDRGIPCTENGPLHTPLVRESAERWPGLYLGTSSWSFPGWEGLVYGGRFSEQRLAREGLFAYSRSPLFRTVSLDRTYYRPMDLGGYRRLAGQVGDGFRFLVKAPRDLLQVGPRGFDLAAFGRDFLTPLVRGLGHKLGVILLQFPPGTFSDAGPSFLGHLGKFLRGLPNELVYSLEIRDEELLVPQLSEAMRGTPTSLCASIHPHLPAPDQQLLRVPPTPEIPLVFRWNLRPSLDYQEARNNFQPFSSLALEDQGRRALLARLVARALEAGRSVYLTANNKAEGCAPLTLLRFLEELSSQNT